MSLMRIEPDGLTLDGAPFYLASGDFHYFRVLPGGWRRRLALMKDFGLTAVQTYVPWNLHEPHPGCFDFSGRLDLAAFLRLCAEMELYVLLRPSPYICSEWDLGGLPAWLLKTPDIALRTSDPRFMQPVTRYLRRLCEEFVPLLSTHGGPVLAVAVENEYGSYGDDRTYLRELTALLRECGVDVPLYATDGALPVMLQNGAADASVWQGVNYRIESRAAIASLRRHQPDKPPLVGEYWCGRSMHWQDEFHHREAEPCAKGYRNALEAGAYVNFYMFAGGTNFGFMHGANEGRLGIDGLDEPARYIPGMTSYDVDALVSENGVPTEKYYACRRELDAYLGRPSRPADPPPYEAQQPERVLLTERFGLFTQLDVLTQRREERANVCCMEELDQDYGLILYTTHLRYSDDAVRRLRIEGLADRALVYVDGVYRGCMMRDQAGEPVRFTIAPEGSCLQILVENMGRINFGRHLNDRKGITGFVALDLETPDGDVMPMSGVVMNWEIRTLPLSSLDGLHPGDDAVDSPAFYRGTFAARPGVDTFVDMRGWHMGLVWVNGFHLGRFWEAGPQQALYLPGELLRERNELCILEMLPDHAPWAAFRDTPALVGNLTDKPVHSYRAEE